MALSSDGISLSRESSSAKAIRRILTQSGYGPLLRKRGSFRNDLLACAHVFRCRSHAATTTRRARTT